MSNGKTATSGFYLLVRAASDESSVAACPLTHQVQMICKLKSIEPLIMPFNVEKRSREFLEVNSTGKVPVLIHNISKEEALVLDDPLLIAKYLEGLHPHPSITSTSRDALDAGSNIFQKFCALIKNKDPSKDGSYKAALLRKMEDLDLFLRETEGAFLEGDSLKISDCSLLTKLLLVRVAAKELKGVEIPARLESVWRYIQAGEKNGAFRETCPSDELIKEHWSRDFTFPMQEGFDKM